MTEVLKAVKQIKWRVMWETKPYANHTYQHRPTSRRLSQPETAQQCDYRRKWVHHRVTQPKAEQTPQETEPSRRKPKERMRKGRTFDPRRTQAKDDEIYNRGKTWPVSTLLKKTDKWQWTEDETPAKTANPSLRSRMNIISTQRVATSRRAKEWRTIGILRSKTKTEDPKQNPT